jgi:hypothetical protein
MVCNRIYLMTLYPGMPRTYKRCPMGEFPVPIFQEFGIPSSELPQFGVIFLV